ncbi:hypothetical protein DFH06DRAFT_1122766 [Mycena polygramma]|nr:hypothetical protein DFH06DRAFT_1122766 [Mycena polygramma]
MTMLMVAMDVLDEMASGEIPDAWDGGKIRRTSSPRLRGCGITDPAVVMQTVSQRVKGPNEYRVRVGGPKKTKAAELDAGRGMECRWLLMGVRNRKDEMASGEIPDAWDGGKIRRTSSPRLRGCGITDPQSLGACDAVGIPLARSRAP